MSWNIDDGVDPTELVNYKGFLYKQNGVRDRFIIIVIFVLSCQPQPLQPQFQEMEEFKVHSLKNQVWNRACISNTWLLLQLDNIHHD